MVARTSAATALARGKSLPAASREDRAARAARDVKRVNEALRLKIRAYEEVKRSLVKERRFRRTVEDSLLTGVIVGDRRGCIVDVNPAFRKMTGWRKRDLIGCTAPFPFWAPEEAKVIAKIYRGFLRGARPPGGFQLRFCRKNGERFDAWVMAAVIADPRDDSIGWVASVSDVTHQRRTEAALRESEARLRRLSGELLAVEEQERKRISRELHDGLGQTLSALKYRLEEAVTACDSCRGAHLVREKLSLAAKVLATTIREVRTIVTGLRPSLLDDLGLLAAISWFCREFRKTRPGVRIRTDIGVAEREVPAALKTPIFRLLQEAMTNVGRHSGADFVRVGLRRSRGVLLFTVRDNGCGFSDEPRPLGVGIIGMKERTELTGGRFSLDSRAGKGTTVRASWPNPAPPVAR